MRIFLQRRQNDNRFSGSGRVRDKHFMVVLFEEIYILPLEIAKFTRQIKAKRPANRNQYRNFRYSTLYLSLLAESR